MEELTEESIDEAINFMKKISTKTNEKKETPFNYGKKYKGEFTSEYTTTKCNICKISFKISSTYDGEYPLCYIHRDPNQRLKHTKKKK